MQFYDLQITGFLYDQDIRKQGHRIRVEWRGAQILAAGYYRAGIEAIEHAVERNPIENIGRYCEQSPGEDSICPRFMVD